MDIVDPDGNALARGLVSYSSEDLPAMLGRNTQEMVNDLGAAFDRAVVHRDAMVTLDHSV